MKRFLIFLLELSTKLLLSFIAWTAMFFVYWHFFIGDHAGVIGPYQAEILGQAYLYILLFYLLIDCGILVQFIKPKWPKKYWITSILTLFLLTFSIGFSARNAVISNLLLGQAFYVKGCAFKPENAWPEKGIHCDRFLLSLQSVFTYHFR
jgi:hypothetical protein